MHNIRAISYGAICVSLMAVCSWISIPFAIPFTLQTFAVFFTTALMGPKRALIALIAYLLLGACGLPVFSGFTGGVSVILGPTGGFIAGFIPAVAISGMIMKSGGSARMVAGMLIGLVSLYAAGSIWYMLAYDASLAAVMSVCVLPFIPGDIAKILLAAYLGNRLKQIVR